MKNKILAIIIGCVALVGCSDSVEKPSETNKETVVETNNTKEKSTGNEKKSEIFDKYNTNLIKILDETPYTTKDLESLAREPDKYIGQKFIYIGEVVKSETSDKKQVLTIEIDNTETLVYGKGDYEKLHIAKVNYDLERFNNKRILEGDRIVISAKFNDILTDEKYGDVLSFDVIYEIDVDEYLAILGVKKYLNSVGANVEDLELNLLKYKDDADFENIVGSETANRFSPEPIPNSGDHGTLRRMSLFSTNSDVYWLVGAYFSYMDGMYIYTGKKDDSGGINFEERAVYDIDIQELESSAK